MGFPQQIFPSQAFPIWSGVKWICRGYNKIDRHVCDSMLKSADGREKLDKLLFFYNQSIWCESYHTFAHFCCWKQNGSSAGDTRVHLPCYVYIILSSPDD